MQRVGEIADIWRYPVKGMRGESLRTVHLDAHGVAGDRRFAIESSGAPRGKPLLSGAERAAMLLYQARLEEGSRIRVTTPRGVEYAVDDPALLTAMQTHLPGGHDLSLVQSNTPQTDVRPVALLGTGTAAQLEREVGRTVDTRRFRANLFVHCSTGFGEDDLVGRDLHVGDAVLRITERIPRCRIVTLDPLTAAPNPDLMKHLGRAHEGRVGIYAVVAHPGRLCIGDTVYAI